MRKLRQFIGIVSGCILAMSLALGANHSLSLEDILKMDDVGNVAIDPQSKRVVFERIPSSLKRRDFALSEPRFAAELYEYDLAHAGESQQLIPDANVTGRWMGDFSPDGAKIIVYWYEGELTKVGAYDFANHSLQKFPIVPFYGFEDAPCLWASQRNVVCAALADQSSSVGVAFRRDAARRLSAQWERAWSGEISTADVLRVPNATLDSAMNRGLLVRVDTSNGEVTPLSDGLFVSLSMSPNRRYLVASLREGFAHSGPLEKPGLVPNAYRYKPVLLNVEYRERPIALCVECEAIGSSVRWNIEGTAVVFFARGAGDEWAQGTYHRHDLLSGRTVPLPHTGLDLVSQRERGLQALPELAVPIADGIAVAARALPQHEAKPLFSDRPFMRNQQGRVDWYLISPTSRPRNLTASLQNVSPRATGANDRSLLLLADGDIWRVDTRKAPANLTSHVSPRLELLDISYAAPRQQQRSTTSLLARPENSFGELIALVPAGNSLRARTVTHNGELIAASADGQIFVTRTYATHGELTLERSGRNSQALWTFNSHLKDVTPAREVNIKYQLGDGTHVMSCALLPPERKDGNRAPIIAYVYPGGSRGCMHFYQDGISNGYDPELFASLGYVVLFPYAPEEKLRSGENPLANWASLVLPAIDAADSAGYGDASRIGVFGMSYGAISVLALLTQTDRFNAAVVSHGAANFSSHYGTLGIVRRMLPTDAFGLGQSILYESKGSYLWLDATPWDKPDRYVTASPLFELERVQTPLMLMHSDLDWNYQMDQFDQVFVGLFRLGREAEYVRYWGEGHGLVSPANLRDMWARMQLWYGNRLRDPGVLTSE